MADTYTPNAGMKAAARRALKWKEDGKATGAGTPVGWGRATDIVNGSAMSLSTVKRMFSFLYYSHPRAASRQHHVSIPIRGQHHVNIT